MKKLRLEEFIEKANKIHNNKFDYSKFVYVNNCTKGIIICPTHKEFSQRPAEHLNGCSCPHCSKNKIGPLPKTKKTVFEFINESKKIHNNKYNYSKVNYTNVSTEVIIICPIHGEFKQKPNKHLMGQGCKLCFLERHKESLEGFVNKANKIHNNKYDYLKVNYINANTKIIIICPIHGEFKQLPSSHLQGHGCRACTKKTSESFINEALKVHGNKYIYAEINYIDTETKIKIICPIHGNFYQVPSEHLFGHGCFKCSCDNKRKNVNQVIKEFNKIHNNKYDYLKVNYINANTKIIIICPIHGEFKQTPAGHLRGKGCSKCSRNVSKKCKKWLDLLNNPNIIREEPIMANGRRYIVDGIDYTTNTVYEFDGEMWHGNPKSYDPNDINPVNKKTYGELYRKTLEKKENLEKAGYTVISIWESDFDKTHGK